MAVFSFRTASAGIGRTGTYIALDNLLCEAAATLALDFNTCVWKLRQARVNMIQTVVSVCVCVCAVSYTHLTLPTKIGV